MTPSARKRAQACHRVEEPILFGSLCEQSRDRSTEVSPLPVLLASRTPPAPDEPSGTADVVRDRRLSLRGLLQQLMRRLRWLS
jgi:hypothetical protein